MTAPRFFVLGAGRSGTSILQEVLSLHPQLVVSHELRVLELALIAASVFDTRGAPLSDPNAPKSALGIELGREFVAALGEEQLRAAGKSSGVYADKYPPYCEQLAALDALWPRARFVHILRDGRDVLASAHAAFVTDRGWRRDRSVPPQEAIVQQWTRHVKAARAHAAKLAPGRYVEVRYEDLTSRPRDVLTTIFDFVGLEPGAALETMAARLRPGKTWRETLAHSELAAFERDTAASELNRELGYPPTALGESEPRVESDAANWTEAIQSAAQWFDAGEAALARGDQRRAVFAFLRAIRGPQKDLRGALRLLEMHERPESLFAAMNALHSGDPGARSALARWMHARGLDRDAARAVMGLAGGAQ